MHHDDLSSQLITDLTRTSPALAQLAQNEDALGRIMKAYETQDAQTVRQILSDLELMPFCRVVCDWLCLWHCFRVCRLICREFPQRPLEFEEIQNYAIGLTRLAEDEEATQQLFDAVARVDSDLFHKIINQFELHPFCFYITYWICHLHCRRFCRIICPPLDFVDELEPIEEFRQLAVAAGKLVEAQLLEEALKATEKGDVERLQDIFRELQIIPCYFICRWLCFIHCHRVCLILCPKPPRSFTARQMRDFLLQWKELTANQDILSELVAAHQRQDSDTFNAILKEYRLHPFCYIVCYWICHFHCRIFCRLVCPPRLVCRLDDPKGCVAEEVLQKPTALVVAVRGSAAGGDFDHYILEWSTDDVTYNATNFLYPPIPPGSGTQGNNPVNNGLLAYFNTTALDADDYFIRLTVHSKRGATRVCKTQFSLFKQDVRILGVSGFTNLDKPALDPDAKFVAAYTPKCSTLSSLQEVSFGRNISVQGSAFVGGCDEKEVKRYTLSYKQGHETNCAAGGWTQFWQVEYNTVWQYRDMNMRQDTDTLTAVWGKDCVIPIPFPPYCLQTEPDAVLKPSSWKTNLSNCELSGLYTLRLDVEDKSGNHYCDLQRVWLDNKPIHARLRIDAVASCADINLSDLVNTPDCAVPWPLPLVGIAYDEYIDESLPLNVRPNDNFDYYWIKVQKQGGPQIQIPIDAPDGSCFYGTQRVGEPGNRCDSPGGSDVIGTLANFDLRAIDAVCKANTSYATSIPNSFTLARGECCVYIFSMRVYDNTRFSGGPRHKDAFWAVKICNDL